MIFIANESRGLITQAYAMTIATLKLVVNNLGLVDACRISFTSEPNGSSDYVQKSPRLTS